MAVDVGILILAAGSSRRLGRPKQLLVLDGKTLLQTVIDTAAQAAVGPVVVVLGAAGDEIAATLTLPACAQIVRNADHETGQASSLRVGLNALPQCTSRAVILLADQPHITSEAICAVAAGTGAIRRARYRDGYGHPVAFDRSVWADLCRLTGDRGARDLLASRDVALVDIDGRVPSDVDTAADAQAMGLSDPA